jgi:mono/diheme cytochrome c family protein
MIADRCRISGWLIRCGAIVTFAIAGGCHRDMLDQPRSETFEASDFFADGRSARLPVPGTVARGHLDPNEAFWTGKEEGQLVSEIPIEVDRQLLERGRERFNIYCAVCHAPTGTGEGMIVQRGFRRPPSYHSDRLRNAPAGHFFDVMTNGFGAMPRFGPQIRPRDRWAIVSYIRALQLSQHATLEDVPPEYRQSLEESGE